MATRKWQQRKETFNPEKNYFDITYVEVSRETSTEENKLERLSNTFDVLAICFGVLGALCLLLGGAAFSALNLWLAFWINFISSVGGVVVALTVFLKLSWKYDELHAKYLKTNDVWNTPEVQEIKRHNKEQNEFAIKWRAEHPLEEKIRFCLMDPKSSVDVANLARYYAEVYLKEKENEDLG